MLVTCVVRVNKQSSVYPPLDQKDERMKEVENDNGGRLVSGSLNILVVFSNSQQAVRSVRLECKWFIMSNICQ